MQTIRRTELIGYVLLYGVCVLGCHTHVLYTGTGSRFEDLPPSAQTTVVGFYNTRATDFSFLEGTLALLPSLFVFSVVCLTTNALSFRNRHVIAEACSVVLILREFGVEFTLCIVGISILFAVIGKSCRGYALVPLLAGVLALLYVEDVVDAFFSNPTAYAGFFASIVRSLMIGCDFAKVSQSSVTYKDAISDAAGFAVSPCVFMVSSFVSFSDWREWRHRKPKLTCRAPFHLEQVGLVGKTTTRRKLSLEALLRRLLVLAGWVFAHKYLLCSVDMSQMVLEPATRLLSAHANSSLDWILVFYAGYGFLTKFTLFYIVVYGISRLVGDAQQFLLSPALGRIFCQPSGRLGKSWRNATVLKRLMSVEVTMECLMPDGPCFPMFEYSSSCIWRHFDVGLYNFLKHYIYLPWIETLCPMVKERCFARLLRELAMISGAFWTFIFVLVFHNFSKGNCFWVAMSFCLWIVERFGIRFHVIYRAILLRYISASWERRLICALRGIIQLINNLSFMHFIGDFDAGFWAMKGVLLNPGALLFGWTVYYAGQQLSWQHG